MSSKNVVITGANSGIGFACALHFAREGEHVVMACRSLDKAEQAQKEILEAVPHANTTIIRLDVSELDSVQEFARQFAEQCGQLDILINNAGIIAMPMSRNSRGHESQLATNYLGAFALTGLLLPQFPAEGPGRIVNVGSLAHRFGTLNLDDLNWEETPYNEWKGYANSKVAMLSYTLELNRRLQASGSKVIALGAHPGFANTNVHQNSPTLARRKGPVGTLIREKIMKRFIPLPESAARPIILAATGEHVQGGEYYGPRGLFEIGGKPGKARINPLAKDPEVARKLWALSEEMTGMRYLSDL